MSGSGYDIKKFCNNSIGYFWHENYGHIYPVLKKLENENLVTKQVEHMDGKPSRNIYSITDSGRLELAQWLKLPIDAESIRSELLLKIFLSENIPIKDIIKNIYHMKESCQTKLLQFSNIEQTLNDNTKYNKKNHILWSITLNNGKYSAEARLKWCNETIELLTKIKDL